MPFIVSTRRPQPGFYSAVLDLDPDLFGAEAAKEAVVSRHAVATLEEARDHAGDVVARAERALGTCGGPYATARTLPESGGSVGPLPDGSLIEVKRIEWLILAALVDVTHSEGAEIRDEIIAAYNSKQAT